MDEVLLAIDKGYVILEINEVFEYKVTRCDPKTRDGGLFADYIGKLLKLKAEENGYPVYFRNPADEGRYI